MSFLLSYGHVQDSITEEESLVKALSEDQEEQSKICFMSNQIMDDTDQLRDAVNERSGFRGLLDYQLEVYIQILVRFYFHEKRGVCGFLIFPMQAKDEWTCIFERYFGWGGGGVDVCLNRR